ncbi:ceramide synthase 1, partial [Brachionus plicatilis]
NYEHRFWLYNKPGLYRSCCWSLQSNQMALSTIAFRWLNETQVPYDIKVIYLAEASFYIHSIYATIFMDSWRKDFVIMLVHHFVTVTLLVGSYGLRFHRFGILVLFFHDVNDLLLEFTKCNVYLKERNGKFYSFHETISFIGFGTFTITWYVFRLYWFPGVITCHRAYQLAYKNGAKFYPLFNGLLFTLFLLNVYWFYLILRMLFRLLKNRKDTDDIRDYESDEDEKKQN